MTTLFVSTSTRGRGAVGSTTDIGDISAASTWAGLLSMVTEMPLLMKLGIGLEAPDGVGLMGGTGLTIGTKEMAAGATGCCACGAVCSAIAEASGEGGISTTELL